MNTRVIVVSAAVLVTATTLAAARLAEIRVTPAEVDEMQAHDAGAGTSGVAGIRTTVVMGDPTQPGPYTIRLSVPAKTHIQAHTHRDSRTAIVVAGTWYFGYGNVASAATEKALPPGSFYTEPGGVAHFAETKDSPVVVYINGFGPTDTVYVDHGDDHSTK
jgi:quercetin dioxygenase-like cupin family protein